MFLLQRVIHFAHFKMRCVIMLEEMIAGSLHERQTGNDFNIKTMECSDGLMLTDVK